MTKIKIFRHGSDRAKLVDEVNEFIKGKDVVKITHSVTYVDTVYTSSGIPTDGTFYDSVMVVYKEAE